MLRGTDIEEVGRRLSSSDQNILTAILVLFAIGGLILICGVRNYYAAAKEDYQDMLHTYSTRKSHTCSLLLHACNMKAHPADGEASRNPSSYCDNCTGTRENTNNTLKHCEICELSFCMHCYRNRHQGTWVQNISYNFGYGYRKVPYWKALTTDAVVQSGGPEINQGVSNFKVDMIKLSDDEYDDHHQDDECPMEDFSEIPHRDDDISLDSDDEEAQSHKRPSSTSNLNEEFKHARARKASNASMVSRHSVSDVSELPRDSIRVSLASRSGSAEFFREVPDGVPIAEYKIVP